MKDRVQAFQILAQLLFAEREIWPNLERIDRRGMLSQEREKIVRWAGSE